MALELEYETVMIPITESFQDTLKEYVAQRWEILPGTTGVAVYHLVRIKRRPEQDVEQAAAIGGFGSLQIDENKITILRGGKPVRPDGTAEDVPKIHEAGAKLG